MISDSCRRSTHDASLYQCWSALSQREWLSIVTQYVGNMNHIMEHLMNSKENSTPSQAELTLTHLNNLRSISTTLSSLQKCELQLVNQIARMRGDDALTQTLLESLESLRKINSSLSLSLE